MSIVPEKFVFIELLVGLPLPVVPPNCIPDKGFALCPFSAILPPLLVPVASITSERLVDIPDEPVLDELSAKPAVPPPIVISPPSLNRLPPKMTAP